MNLTPEKHSLKREIMTQGAQAQYGMWSAAGNVLGFLAGASAVVATINPAVSRLALMFVLLSGVTGLTVCFGCFRVYEKMFSSLLEMNDLIDGVSEENKRNAYQRASGSPKTIDIYERYIFLCMVAAILSFFWLIWPILFKS
jgi:hypothetical protein